MDIHPGRRRQNPGNIKGRKRIRANIDSVSRKSFIFVKLINIVIGLGVGLIGLYLI